MAIVSSLLAVGKEETWTAVKRQETILIPHAKLSADYGGLYQVCIQPASSPHLVSYHLYAIRWQCPLRDCDRGADW